jgi:hypothetical protein
MFVEIPFVFVVSAALIPPRSRQLWRSRVIVTFTGLRTKQEVMDGKHLLCDHTP